MTVNKRALLKKTENNENFHIFLANLDITVIFLNLAYPQLSIDNFP